MCYNSIRGILIFNKKGENMDPVDAVNGASSTVDPNMYSLDGSGSTSQTSKDPSLAGMAESMHMTGEDLHKFMQNLLNSITNSIKSDTDHAVESLKDATKRLEEASNG